MEDEQLKNTLHSVNYHAQYQPPLPRNQLLQQQNQISIVPQQPPRYHVRPQFQQVTSVPQQPQPIQQAQPAQPSQNNLSTNDLSFLVKSIKDSLREDLAKEITQLKQDLNLQIQQASRPQIITNPPIAQTQAASNLCYYQMPVNPQVFPPQP